MAGPVFIRSGARVQSAGATTLTPTKPTVDGAGGAMLAVLSTKNNAVHATATAGWTRIGAQTNSGASFTASLWIAAEGAAAPVFTWAGSVACEAQISYYTDPANSIDTAIGASSVSAGTVSPHTSTSINTTRANTLGVYVDVAAANTALTNPAGYTQDVSNGSATDAGRTTFGSKAVAVSGTATGAISVAGAAAAWVQWQVEIRGAAPAAAFQVSKEEAGTWLQPPDAFDVSLIEAGAWLDATDGVGASKIEAGVWYEPTSTLLEFSKIEGGIWLQAVDAFDVALFESGAWLDAPDGSDFAKIESGAWLEPEAVTFDLSKFEDGAWLDPIDGFGASKFEVGMWLETAAAIATRKRAAQVIG